MSSVFTKLKKFLTKHSDEVRDVADVIGTIAKVLPIDRADREKIAGVAEKLEKASAAIADSVERMKDETVSFNANDVKVAVGAFLKSSDGRKLLQEALGVEAKKGFTK